MVEQRTRGRRLSPKVIRDIIQNIEIRTSGALRFMMGEPDTFVQRGRYVSWKFRRTLGTLSIPARHPT
jgi:hypothetical protein